MSHGSGNPDEDEFLPPPPRVRPLWVRLALWGLPTRTSARAYCAASAGLAAAAPVAAHFTGNEWFYCGFGFALSGAWCAAAINWVDRNDWWE